MKTTVGIVLGSIVVATTLGMSALPAAAQRAIVYPNQGTVNPGEPRLCLRADNRSLLRNTYDTEGSDAYDRVAALGNRCFTNFYVGQQTLLPVPQSDPLDAKNYYFLSRAQRERINPALGLPVDRP